MQNNINYVALFLVISMAAYTSFLLVFFGWLSPKLFIFYDSYGLFYIVLLSLLFNVSMTLYKNTIRYKRKNFYIC